LSVTESGDLLGWLGTLASFAKAAKGLGVSPSILPWRNRKTLKEHQYEIEQALLKLEDEIRNCGSLLRKTTFFLVNLRIIPKLTWVISDPSPESSDYWKFAGRIILQVRNIFNENLSPGLANVPELKLANAIKAELGHLDRRIVALEESIKEEKGDLVNNRLQNLSSQISILVGNILKSFEDLATHMGDIKLRD